MPIQNLPGSRLRSRQRPSSHSLTSPSVSVAAPSHTDMGEVILTWISPMSSGRRILLTLSVLLSSTSLLLTACDTFSPPVSNLAETSTGRPMAQPFVPGEALVKFKPSVSHERIDVILKECGTELITEIKGMGVYHVRIVGKESVEAVVKKLSAFQEVAYAEPNFRFRTQ